GRFAASEYDVGLAGGFATPAVNQLLAEADVVLAVGASLNEHTTANGRLFADAFVVHADRDPGVIGRQTRADLALVGDAADTVAALAAAVAGAGPAQTGYRTPQVAARIAASRRALDHEVMHTSRSVDPRAALRAIDDAITPTRRVVVDVGHFSTFPCQTMPAAFAGQLLPALGFAAVGLGVPTAIGAALATDDPVVAVVGDGGMLMSLPELRTLARTGARVVVAVLNDAAYGAEVHHLRRRGLVDAVARFDATDFVAVAEALGIPAARIDAPDDLDRLPTLLSSLDGPQLLDIAINPAVVADKFQ
ncbi:MAG: thiamine pyrophosphate-dependent enzyme, partial [Nitriliruptoraceae bacterium]